MQPAEPVDVAVEEVRVAADQPAVLVVDVIPPAGPAVAVPGGAPAPATPAPCAFARGTATSTGIRLAPLDAALAPWMAARFGPLRVEAPGVAGCEGLPPVDRVVVPPSGAVIGLRAAAADSATGGAVEAHPIGEDRRWWHVHAAGPGSVVFRHGEDPPTRLGVQPDDALVAPASRTVAVPRGGAVAVDVEGPITHAEVQPPEVARFQAAGRHLVVLSAGTSDVLSGDAVLRVGDQAPQAVRVEVGAPPGPDAREVRVRVGSKRRLTVDTEVRAAWIAAPGLADVSVDRGRLTVQGLAPGRTALVIDGADGPLVVPLAVGR